MSSEPGERRRRRELERARELATEQTSAARPDAGSPPAVAGRPVTSVTPVRSRRELRDRERALAAELAAGGEASAPDSRPAPAAMRNASKAAESTRTPVVHPPATTGAIRSVAPAVAESPHRTESADGATAARGYPAVAPRRSALSPKAPAPGLPGAAVRPTSSAIAPSAALFGATGTPPEGGPAEMVPTAAADGAFTTPAPAQGRSGGATAGSTQRDLPPSASAAAGTQASAPGTARQGGEPLAPRRGHPPTGSFDALTRTPAEEARTANPVRSPVEEKDATSGPRASYTWMQVVALALVAFVLGFIVWQLFKGSTEPESPGASAPGSFTTSSGTTVSRLGDL